MQNPQGNAAPVPHPRPDKPDYSGIFLEPVYTATAWADDDPHEGSEESDFITA